jgi:hypothetical protein
MPKCPAEFVFVDPIYTKFEGQWSNLCLRAGFCCVLAGYLRHAATFLPYPENTFWLVRLKSSENARAKQL